METRGKKQGEGGKWRRGLQRERKKRKVGALSSLLSTLMFSTNQYTDIGD